jgi:hypothetical protein
LENTEGGRQGLYQKEESEGSYAIVVAQHLMKNIVGSMALHFHLRRKKKQNPKEIFKGKKNAEEKNSFPCV